MKIPWEYTEEERIIRIEQTPELLYVREFDCKMFNISTSDYMLEFIENKENFNYFTKEEIIFLKELIETRDSDNLLIAYQIIENK